MTSALHIKVAIGAIALIVGVAGGAASATPETKIKTVAVEKTVEVPVEKIVDREVEVEVVPGVCLEALELGAGIGDSVGQIIDHHSAFLGAILDDDLGMMSRLNARGPDMYAYANSNIAEFRRAANACESIGAEVRARV